MFLLTKFIYFVKTITPELHFTLSYFWLNINHLFEWFFVEQFDFPVGRVLLLPYNVSQYVSKWAKNILDISNTKINILNWLYKTSGFPNLMEVVLKPTWSVNQSTIKLWNIWFQSWQKIDLSQLCSRIIRLRLLVLNIRTFNNKWIYEIHIY